MKTFAPLVIAAVFLATVNAVRAANPVIVHEWGTFTSLQDEKGQAIGGINVDDEPVPSFVYDSGYVHNQGAAGARVYNFGLPPYYGTKGWRPADQDVTMRLETPVLYFYPPKGDAGSLALPLKVHVDFRGGLLSQYYPYAETNGFPDDFPYNQKVDIASCTSGLTWTVTHFGSDQKVVETSDKVWTTPREVSAPEIEVKAKEFSQDANKWIDTPQAEHFLFYRGVGHLDSPVFLNSQGDKFGVGLRDASIQVISGWLVQIRADGTCASRFVQNEAFGVPTNAMPVSGGMPSWLNYCSRSFADSDYAPRHLARLKSSMQDALVKEGLFPDEASAMLRTWELSYFRSPGLRFFYIVPRAWVDKTLPLAITGAPVEVTRVMVGRIELISDEQKATLARLARGGYPDLAALDDSAQKALAGGKYSKEEARDFYCGARPLSELGITLSESVRDYLSLGRFRDALLVHEEQEHPSDTLSRFIRQNGLADANSGAVYTTITPRSN